MGPTRIAIALALGATALALPVRGAEFTETFTFDAKTLLVNNLIGAIEIEGHRGSDFEVEVTVRGDDASQDAIRFDRDNGSFSRLFIQFPIDDERRFVYPEMEFRSTSFNLKKSNDGGESGWWDKMWNGGGRQIKVTRDGSGMEVWADVVIRVPRGKKLSVNHGTGATTARNVNGDLDLDSHTGTIRAEGIEGNVNLDNGSGDILTKDVTGSSNVDTGSGDVEVSGNNGSVNVDTGSGDVYVEDADGDRVSVDTGSGSVTMENITTLRLDVDTGSGTIRARGVETEHASLDTGSGSVHLLLDRLGDGDVDIDTGSGSITLGLPSNASARVDASTGSGGIRIDLDDYELLKKGHNSRRFLVGDGGSRIQLETGSGSIKIVGDEG